MMIAFAGIVVLVALFGSMVVLLEYGRRLGKRWLTSDDTVDRTGRAAMEGATFALMGLLLAFSFSGALNRWDMRRGQIADEANAIGTAYLRVDLLPKEAQSEIRARFREYADARLAVYRDVADMEKTREDQAKAAAIQGEIWRRSLEACAAGPPATSMLVVTSLNEMFDMATKRDFTARLHPPLAVFLMLGVAVLTSSLLAGYDMAVARRASRIHMIGYASMLALTIFVNLDTEFPRIGFVRLDSADVVLESVRAGMK
jgi:hypothetical protein